VTQNFIVDIRYALRSLRKNPGFTALAVVVMALGIGANTAVFSGVNSVLLRPLDHHDPDRIVTVANQWKTGSAPQGQVSAPDFHDWHDQTNAFAALAYYLHAETSLTAGSTAEYGRIASVTPEVFRVFAVDPVIGRPFSADEMRPASAGAISYGYRQSQPARPELFMQYQHHPRAGMSMSVIVRTTTDPTAVIDTLRRKAHDVTPDVPVKFTTLEARLAEDTATPRFRAILLGIFAALAVCLAIWPGFTESWRTWSVNAPVKSGYAWRSVPHPPASCASS